MRELDSKKTAARPLRKFLWIVGTILTVVILGYISNYLSAPVCQKTTKMEVSKIIRDQPISSGKTIIWIDEERVITYSCEDMWGASCGFEIFNIEFPLPWFFPYQYNYRPERSAIEYFKGDGSDPYAYIKTRKWDLPFIITEHYGWMAGALWGRGGAKIYLCLFGFVIELKDIRLWIS